jgi:hypothetical protein
MQGGSQYRHVVTGLPTGPVMDDFRNRVTTPIGNLSWEECHRLAEKYKLSEGAVTWGTSEPVDLVLIDLQKHARIARDFARRSIDAATDAAGGFVERNVWNPLGLAMWPSDAKPTLSPFLEGLEQGAWSDANAILGGILPQEGTWDSPEDIRSARQAALYARIGATSLDLALLGKGMSKALGSPKWLDNPRVITPWGRGRGTAKALTAADQTVESVETAGDVITDTAAQSIDNTPGVLEVRDGSVASTRPRKFVPNPDGKLGKPPHRTGVADVVRDIKARGLKPETEVPIKTVGDAEKGTRVVDVVARVPGSERIVEVHQVGDTLKRHPLVPVGRERDALRDIRHSPIVRGAKRIFHRKPEGP